MAKHHHLVLAELRAELADVESKRAALDLQCTRIQGAITLLEERVGVSGASLMGVLSTMSMPDALLACLSAAGRPLLKRDLMTMLREGGWQAKEHFSQHVYNTLDRLKSQGKVRQGQDGHWMPAPLQTVLPDGSRPADDRDSTELNTVQGEEPMNGGSTLAVQQRFERLEERVEQLEDAVGALIACIIRIGVDGRAPHVDDQKKLGLSPRSAEPGIPPAAAKALAKFRKQIVAAESSSTRRPS